MKFYKPSSKKLLFLAALCIGVGAVQMLPVSAEKPGSKPGQHKPGEHKRGEGRGRRGRMGEKFAKELGLTEKQKASMQKVMKESRAKSEKIRNDKSLSEDQKRKKMMANREDTRKRMNAILTPKQRDKAKKMREEWRKEHPRGGGFGGPGRGPKGNYKKPA
jgi:periplasmic protein CpxP/Spy